MTPLRFHILLGLLAAPLAAQDHLYTITGTAPNLRSGFSAVGLGDVNADGYGDFVVAQPGFAGNAGRVLVYSGQTGLALRTIADGVGAEQFGWSAANVGDLDGDQVADFVVGAPFADVPTTGQSVLVDAGRVVAYSGKTGKVLHTWKGPFARSIFGISVGPAGDVDKDGTPDVIVGAHGVGTHGVNAGGAFVFSGKDGSKLWTFLGDDAFDFFGHSVANFGDVDGDGHSDLVVGAPDDDNGGNGESGMARVYSGKTGLVLKTFNGDAASDFFGHSVRNAGDVNNDGSDDLIVGAGQFFVTQGKGYARVYSGKDFSVLHTLPGSTVGDFFGEPVEGLGDIDGDGFDDLLVGAHRADPGGRIDAGMVYAFSGKTGSELFRWSGAKAGDFFGNFVTPAGDVNGDGTPDLIVGAPGVSIGGSSGGAATVFSGKLLKLRASSHDISLMEGGEHVLSLRAGVANKGLFYLIQGSMSGTNPGLRLPPSNLLLPLNADAYLTFTLTSPNSMITASLGFLNAKGEATARISVPKGFLPFLADSQLHHAYTVFDLTKLSVETTSNAVPLHFRK